MTKIREGYKETEIGVIPEDWEVSRLIDIVDKSDRYSFTGGPFGSDLKSSDYTPTGVRVIQLQNIGDGKFYNESVVYTSEEKADQLNNCNIFPNELILAKMADPVARACKIPVFHDRYLMCSDGIRIKCDSNKFDVDYCLYSINSSYFRKKAVENSTGTTRQRIGLTALKELQIIHPTLPEQQRIAEILSTTDAHIEKLDKIIEDYQLLKKGMMKKLLTEGIGHTEFKETEVGRIPKEWDVKTLGEICTIIAGQSPSSETYNENGNGLPFYQGRTEFGSINPITKKWCSEPIKIAESLDILISVRAPVGDVNICETTSCIGRGLALIRETESSKHKFIYYLMQFSIDRLNKVGQGSTFTAINTSDLKNFSVQVPSTEEQELIADNLFEIDKLIELLKEDRNDLVLLKKSLMEKLLTGKVRVI